MNKLTSRWRASIKEKYRKEKKIAIDLGATNTRVYVKRQGFEVCEPSVVAVKKDMHGNNVILAVGHEAEHMIDNAPDDIRAARPMKDGVVADYEVIEAIIRHCIGKVHNSRHLARPDIMICVPTGITLVEKRAIEESARSAGACNVHFIENALAAAIGADLPVSPKVVVDIGSAATEVAVIASSGIVCSRLLRVGGDNMTEALRSYIKRQYNMLIGESLAERIKIQIASACPQDPKQQIEVNGRDMVTGNLQNIIITSGEACKAISYLVDSIVQSIRTVLEQTPPELAADIVDNGIMLTGGGALLNGLAQLLKEATSLPVTLVDDPLSTIILGAGKALEDPLIPDK
ncbi:MAG: rod shape-determining protein [Desulfovibrio sp.]|jgi:rod shape-determining protein MreB|nr:rod shape-determining protein [Desulfovibrio sp.]